MKKLFLWLTALILIGATQGYTRREIPLNLSVIAEMGAYPGFIVGTELPLVENDYHHLLMTGNLGGYLHRRYHLGAFIQSEIGYRLTLPGGFFIDTFAGIGYLHTWVDGTVYAMNDQGTIEPIPNTGDPALMPSVSLSLFGWDFSQKGIADFKIYVRAQLFWQYPVNTQAVMHPVIQTGITIYL